MCHYRLDYISKVPYNSEISLCFSLIGLNTQSFPENQIWTFKIF